MAPLALLQDKEVEVKTEKLQQLRSKYQQVKKEIADIQSNNQRESMCLYHIAAAAAGPVAGRD